MNQKISIAWKKCGFGLSKVDSVITSRFCMTRYPLARTVGRIPLFVWVSVVLIGAVGVILSGYLYVRGEQYVLTSAETRLLTSATVNSKFVSEDKATISYNRAAEQKQNTPKTVLAAAQDATGQVPYKAVLAKKGNQAVTFSDSRGDLSFTMTPSSVSAAGRTEQGRVIYPEGRNASHVYTFKRNGVKEDIILGKAPGNTYTKSWTLDLGDKLSARLLPGGSIGIFSANPYLFGDVTISDAKSQALVDKARTSSKNYLIFAIPAPYIKNSNGQTRTEDVSYKLAGNTLSLEARNLSNQHYPISIDPSVVVTTTADFATGYDDGMINYATADQIGRSDVSLGAVGATVSQAPAFTTVRAYQASAVYSGATSSYIYIVGGAPTSSTWSNMVQSCPIVGSGAVGTCVDIANAFTGSRSGLTSVVYNGYLYVIGGANATAQNDIQFSKINNADGSLSCPSGLTCNGGTVFAVNSTGFTSARWFHSSVVYNGYLFIVGGTTGSYQSDAQHCPINADGSVGACVQQTNAFTNARQSFGLAAYNGYLYMTGGYTGSQQNDIQYAVINADGSLSCPIAACPTTTVFAQKTAAFTTARSGHTTVAYGGYLYVIGGTSSAINYYNDIQRLPINANGSVGTNVSQPAAFTTARSNHTSVVYNGYIYVIGGNGFGAYQNDIQHLLITTGTPSGLGAVGATIQQTNTFTTLRGYHTSVVYNGFVYVIGGYNGAGLNDIQFSAIASDGSLSCPVGYTCSGGTVYAQQLNAFTAARWDHTSVAYNGYLYILGGGNGSPMNDAQYCPFNADGSVGTCTQQTNAFTGARSNHSSAIYKGFVYVIGGTTGTLQNDVQFSSIAANGSLTCPSGYTCAGGTVFAVQAAAFTTARYVHSSMAYNGYIYIISGCSAGACSTYRNDIIHCPINNDGSVGTCVTQAAAFTQTRWSQAAVAYDGYLYISGGANNAIFYNDIIHCPFNADGSVGTCVTQAAAFTTIRADHTMVASAGYIYIIGGGNTGVYYNDTQRLPVGSPSMAAHYERVVDLGKTYDSVNSIQYNGTAPCGVKIQYAVAGTNGIFGSPATVYKNSMPGITYALSNVTLTRYVRLTLTLDDQECGGTSVITDVTINGTLLPPAAPTLSAPISGASGISSTPTFTLNTTDAVDVYAQYKILVYQSDCSTLVRTIDQSGSQTGWTGQDAQTSTAYVVANALGGSTLASHTYQVSAFSPVTTYCWKAAAIDPGGSNTFGSYSATRLFTTGHTPSAPTLTLPASAQTGVTTMPEFRLYAPDPDNDYLRYKIDVCSTSNCSSIVRTIDQTSSQTGWASQSQQSATAYASGQTAIHTYQAAALSVNTQYWWRAYAIDPAGTNTFSAASGIGTFTTTPTTQTNVDIGGGTTIYGGTTVGQ